MSDYKLVPKSIVDVLAQFIRQVDGNHRMGAGALAEKICERFRVDVPAVNGEPVGDLPTLMKIEHHSLGVTIEKDILGTVHIKVGDFDYIQIQYQYPYTDNATQLRHAMLIADALAAPQPAEQQPCPEDIRAGAPYDDPAFESLCREHEIWGTAAAAQCAAFWEAGKRVAEQQTAPDVGGLLNRIIPRIDAGSPNPIDPDIHCCEWTLHRERERIHAEFADALAAHSKGGDQP